MTVVFDDVQFIVELDRFADLPETAIPLVQRQVMFSAVSTLIDMTPVGNPDLWKGGRASAPEGYAGGRAKANWQASVGAPAEGFSEAVDPSGHGATASALAALAVVPPFSSVWASNNLPYIEELEDGHSSQAPGGMLGVVFADIVRTYNTNADAVLKRLGY